MFQPQILRIIMNSFFPTNSRFIRALPSQYTHKLSASNQLCSKPPWSLAWIYIVASILFLLIPSMIDTLCPFTQHQNFPTKIKKAHHSCHQNPPMLNVHMRLTKFHMIFPSTYLGGPDLPPLSSSLPTPSQSAPPTPRLLNRVPKHLPQDFWTFYALCLE